MPKTPYSSPLDFASPYAADGTTALNTYVDLLNIAGSGYLTSISQHINPNGYEADGSLKVIIDGNVVLDSTYFTESSAKVSDADGETYKSNVGKSIMPLWRFNSSLQVQHMISDTRTDVRTTATYVKD